MAQHISIQRISEQEKILGESDANIAEIVNALWQIHNFKEEFPWLSTIDPYGNTYINQPQKQHFLNELTKLTLVVDGLEVIDSIKVFKLFLSETEVHQYIKLIGD